MGRQGDMLIFSKKKKKLRSKLVLEYLFYSLFVVKELCQAGVLLSPRFIYLTSADSEQVWPYQKAYFRK